MSSVSKAIASFPTLMSPRVNTTAVGAITESGPSCCIQSPTALAQFARWYLAGPKSSNRRERRKGGRNGSPSIRYRTPLRSIGRYLVPKRQQTCSIIASELKAQTNGRVDRGSLKAAIRETVRYLRPHDAKCPRIHRDQGASDDP